VEIRRAYRRRLVTSHRERVLKIISHLRHLRHAYATLRDPVLRQDYDVRLSADSLSSHPTRPSNRTTAGSHSPRAIAFELGRHSQRLGAAAVEQSADVVSRLAGEHDAREIATARQRARQALLIRMVKIVIFVASCCAAWLAASWLSGRA